jgi:acetylornithine deacetylase/succinyl-diaminopimelate desuccinylase family protein
MNAESKYEQIMDQCRNDAVQWTAELVRFKSENPPGNEYDVAMFCADKLREIGLEVIVDEFSPKRVNVTAYAGNKEDIGIVFNGHMDVVIANGTWQYPPYSGTIADGYIWGRGSADMKSGCAAMIAAVKALKLLGCDMKKGICISLVADEEAVNKGAIRLKKTTELKADGCIVCEPTKLQVNYGNRGYTSFTVRTYGVACHASEPKKGKNAIYQMAGVVKKLEAFATELEQRTNEQLGSISLSVGVIKGGTSLNMVPDRCEIEVECRVFTGMDATTVLAELQKLLEGEAEVEIRSNLLASLVPLDSRIVRTAAECVRNVTEKEAVITKFPACSEASFFSVGYGIPTILLGPGDISCAHKANERVAIREIKEAVDIYAAIAKKYVG